MSYQAVLDDAMRLGRQERTRLVDALLGRANSEVGGDSADDDVPNPLSQSQRATLDRRIADADAHPERGLTTEEVARSVRESLQVERARRHEGAQHSSADRHAGDAA